jgi:peptide/nickel transport system permease protein
VLDALYPVTRRGRHATVRLGWAPWGLALLLLSAAFAPWVAPHAPSRQHDPTVARVRPPGTVLWVARLADGRERLADAVERTSEGVRLDRRGRVETHAAGQVLNLTEDGVADRRWFLLGTDGVGRDLLSRLIYGARVSLLIGLLAVVLAVVVGMLVGGLAALGPPWLDTLLMRFTDAMLAFPLLFLILAVAALFGPNLGLLVLVLGATSWMSMSRLLRAELLGLDGRPYVDAARGLGQSPVGIFFHHLLPNALAPVLVQAALLVADVILVESSLSFLQFGVQPPTASWGNMVSEGRSFLPEAWWMTLFPGAAIAVTVIAFNRVGDHLRDRLDPRTGEP